MPKAARKPALSANEVAADRQARYQYVAAVIDGGCVYTMPDVARLVFRVTVRSFNRNRDQLRAEGFPKPMVPFGQPRWFGQALLDWCAGAHFDNRPNWSPELVSTILAMRATQAARVGSRKRRKDG